MRFPNFGRVLISATAILALAACCCARSSGQSSQLIMSTEYNASANVTKMYAPYLSVTALLINADGTIAGAGNPIRFHTIGQFDDGTFNKLTYTDSKGRATVAVQATDAVLAVDATFSFSMFVIANGSITINVISDENCFQSGVSPANPNWVLLANPNAITWRYEGGSANLFSQVQAAMTGWHNATGKVTFVGPVAPGAPVDLVFQDECRNSRFGDIYAQTDSRMDGTRVIHFYNSQLNPDPDPTDPACLGYWPPYGGRHHLLTTAIHEIGHVLGLLHNTGSRASIMWVGIDKYFVCGVSSPTQDAIDTIRALYP